MDKVTNSDQPGRSNPMIFMIKIKMQTTAVKVSLDLHVADENTAK